MIDKRCGHHGDIGIPNIQYWYKILYEYRGKEYEKIIRKYDYMCVIEYCDKYLNKPGMNVLEIEKL